MPSPRRRASYPARCEIEVADGGPCGDRYGDAGDMTLIEAEALEGLRADTGIVLSHEESRRQVLTRGVDLNDLVGKRFIVGSVECEGVSSASPAPTSSHSQSRASCGGSSTAAGFVRTSSARAGSPSATSHRGRHP